MSIRKLAPGRDTATLPDKSLRSTPQTRAWPFSGSTAPGVWSGSATAGNERLSAGSYKMENRARSIRQGTRTSAAIRALRRAS